MNGDRQSAVQRGLVTEPEVPATRERSSLLRGRPLYLLLGAALVILITGGIVLGGKTNMVAAGRQVATPFVCPVTLPNGRRPPGETATGQYFGNGKLWTELWPAGIVPLPPDSVVPSGPFSIKWPWWRGVAGSLTVAGRRLDQPARPLAAWIPEGYGERGFQATGLTFPTEGCWEVTGKVGDASLTFVTLLGPPPAVTVAATPTAHH